MQGLWKTKNTGYVKDYKIRKIKRKHFLKDKAKHIIKSLYSPSFVIEYKRNENKYKSIEKKDFLTVYLIEFEKDNNKYFKKGYVHPISKELIFDENNFFKFNRIEYIFNKDSFSFNFPPELNKIHDKRFISSVKAIGTSKNFYKEDINTYNNSFETINETYYNSSYFYQNKLIDKHLYHQLIGKAFTGDSKFDVDGFTKSDKNRKRRLESKKLIKEELNVYGYFDLAEIW